MANIILPPGWQGRERDVTSRTAHRNRRDFLRHLAAGTIAVAAGSSAIACGKGVAMATGGPDGPLDTIPENAPRDGLPAPRNTLFKVPERTVSDRVSASSYNNFYEFDGSSKKVWHLTGDYNPFPMSIEVSGLVEKPVTFDVADLIRQIGVEERIYRFRCVEAWSMTIPWTGFALSKLIALCKPLSTATHVRFVSVVRKSEMPGVRNQPWYAWPYYEGLRMDEAMNDVAFVATGMYGEPLTKQNGSPLRLALPWKYGYKGAKAINRIEFVTREPKTFWNDIAPTEYSFLSNVNPTVPHPRWSQASERYIQTLDEVRRLPTQMFNGYQEFVAEMYPTEPRG